MPSSEHARRKRLWERYILRGEPYEEVIPEIAAEFDVDEETIDEDLATISDWLQELELFRDEGGIALVVELRANRQQLHQLADLARDEEDLTEERQIREEINRSINLERRLHEASLKTKPPSSEMERLMDEL